MRALILAAALAALAFNAGPAAALNPPAPARHQLRELPPDWLDDADLDGARDERAEGGYRDDDRLAGSDRNDRRADRPRDCRESSGTTGAILGAVAGGLLGNVIDGGNHRALGTIVGAGGGALLGREVEKRRAAAGCR